MPELNRTKATRQPPALNEWNLPDSLLGRVYLVATVLLLEYAAIVSAPHPWCHVHRFVAGTIVFFSVLIFLMRDKLRARTAPQLNNSMLAAFLACLALIAGTHLALLHSDRAGKWTVALWAAAIVLSGVSLFFSVISRQHLRGLLRETRSAWVYAICATALVAACSDRIQQFWNVPDTWSSALLQRATFDIVRHVLQWMYGQVSVDPAASTIGLPHFEVTIAGSCAGIEGLTLVLLFSCGWILYARRQLRFPQALVLVPCALSVMYIFNIARIVTLLSIGNAGYAEVAIHGFHSEAGWIAFNAVSVGMLAVAGRIRWFHRNPAPEIADHSVAEVSASGERNVAAIYLLPFLAILVAGSVSKSLSSGFEWMYPLRVMAAVAVLWHYRVDYKRMDRRFTWRGPAAGFLVFALWILLTRNAVIAAHTGLPQGLRSAPVLLSGAWLLVRFIGAVITVPIAEELAFRGFLLRRIDSADVEGLSYERVGPLAIVVSAAAFGALHGSLWMAGVLAGVAYGLLVKWTGRLGEAVAAHATTNLLLAIWVIASGEWGLW